MGMTLLHESHFNKGLVLLIFFFFLVLLILRVVLFY